MDDNCISHLGTIELDPSFIQEIEDRLRANEEKLTLPLEEEIDLLHQIAEFELGRFILKNKGLNGYWTDYMISGDHSNVNSDSIEYWLLKHAPLVKATQERFTIFQDEIQKKLASDMNMASIPCGSMNDLLTLDYSNLSNVHLVGMDIDQNSIDLSQNNVDKELSGSFVAEVEKANAWELDRQESDKFHLITSNGLNIYEPNEERIIALYTKFYQALHPGGHLVTSFISKSPMVDSDSPWKNMDMNSLMKQKAIFVDIIQANWQNSFNEKQVFNHLGQAGFRDIKIIYDSQGMFPTVVAR
jgi:hypothetical protein